MSGMQQIEHAVGEDYATRLSRTPLSERMPRHDFPARIAVAQCVHSTCGENKISRTMSGISTRS